MKKFIPFVFILAATAACQETPEKTRGDVADARAEGAENVREAQAERAQAGRDNANVGQDGRNPASMTGGNGAADRAEADFEVLAAKAKAGRDVAQEQCDALAGDAQDNCEDVAEATYDKAIADAKRSRTRAEGGAPVGDPAPTQGAQ